MFYLILAILSSALVSIMMRVSEGRVKNNISLLSVNYVICLLLACGHMGIGNILTGGEGLGTAVGLGSINGFFYIASFVLFQYNVKKNGVVLSAVFMKLGILVPTLISIFIFHEMPKLAQLIGLFIAVVAIILVNFEKGTTNVTFKLGLPLVLLGSGFADGMSKIFEELGSIEFEEQFLVYTFIIAFVLSIILVKYKRQKFAKEELFYGVLLGIPNYYSARFLLKALGEIAAVVVYPTYSVATIAVVSLVGVAIFKEKFSKRQILAIIIIAISLALLN